MISFSLIKPFVISDLEVICSVTCIGVWIFFIFSFFFLESMYKVCYLYNLLGLALLQFFFFFFSDFRSKFFFFFGLKVEHIKFFFL